MCIWQMVDRHQCNMKESKQESKRKVSNKIDCLERHESVYQRRMYVIVSRAINMTLCCGSYWIKFDKDTHLLISAVIKNQRRRALNCHGGHYHLVTSVRSRFSVLSQGQLIHLYNMHDDLTINWDMSSFLLLPLTKYFFSLSDLLLINAVDLPLEMSMKSTHTHINWIAFIYPLVFICMFTEPNNPTPLLLHPQEQQENVSK